MTRRLLYESSHEIRDEIRVSRAYFLTEEHLSRQPAWNQRSPLPVDVNALISLAIDYYLTTHVDDSLWKITDVELSDNRATDANALVYLRVKFLPWPECDVVDEEDVIVTLSGDVLIPEIREFSDPDDYYAYCDAIFDKSRS